MPEPAGEEALPPDARAFLRAMDARWACKRFDGRPLPASLLRYLLEIGRLTPSSFGLEPCRFIALPRDGEGGKGRMEALRALSFDQEAVGSASLALAILVRRAAAYEPDSAFVRQRSARFPGGHPVFRADYEGYWRFLRDAGRIEEWARAQAYIACGTMMTGAAAAGLDSCAIEGYDEAGLLSFLGEDPDAWRVGILLVFGMAAEERRERIREPLSAVAESRPPVL